MRGEHRVNSSSGHVRDRTIAHDAGIVHQDVDAAEAIHRGLDDVRRALEVGNGVVVRNGFTADGFDLFHDLGGRIFLAAATIDGTANVIDDDLGTFARQRDGDAATDAAARTGYDCNFAL
jgi:hypothetical protein